MSCWNNAHLWLEISVDVSKLVEFVDTHEHLGSVKSSMLFFKHTGIVEQRSEISSWNVFLQISAQAVPDVVGYTP